VNPVPGQHDSGPATIQPIDLKGAGETFAQLLLEVDSRTGESVAASGAAPAPEGQEHLASAPTPEPTVAPTADLYPETTPQGRIQRGYLSGRVTYSAEDVDACRDQLSPAQYHQLRAAAETEDLQAAELARERERLAAAVPDMAADPETQRRFTEEVVALGQELGYTPNEIYAVRDHRALALVARALKATKENHELRTELARYRAGVAQPDERETPARPTQPRRTPAARINDVREALERAAKTGKMRDAAKVFEALGVV